MRRNWLCPAIVIGGLCLFVAVLAALWRIPEQPAHPVRAKVTTMVVEASGYNFWTIVTFSTDDGWTGTTSFPSNQLTCRIGDVVAAEKVGVSLRLAGHVCRTIGPSPRVGRGPIDASADSAVRTSAGPASSRP